MARFLPDGPYRGGFKMPDERNNRYQWRSMRGDVTFLPCGNIRATLQSAPYGAATSIIPDSTWRVISHNRIAIVLHLKTSTGIRQWLEGEALEGATKLITGLWHRRILVDAHGIELPDQTGDGERKIADWDHNRQKWDLMVAATPMKRGEPPPRAPAKKCRLAEWPPLPSPVSVHAAQQASASSSSLVVVPHNKQLTVGGGMAHWPRGGAKLLMLGGIRSGRRSPSDRSTDVTAMCCTVTQWGACARTSLPVACCGSSATVLSSKDGLQGVYVCGGSTNDRGAIATCHRLSHAHSKSWVRLADMSAPRSNTTAVTYGSRVYVVGGMDVDNRPMSTGEVYDPNADHWTALPPLPSPTAVHMSVAHKGYLYVIGGWGPGDQVLSSIYKLRIGDTGDNPPINISNEGSRESPVIVVVDDDSPVPVEDIGDDTIVMDNIQSPSNVTSVVSGWEHVAHLRLARWGGVACILGDDLYVAGGYNPSCGETGSVEKFDLTGQALRRSQVVSPMLRPRRSGAAIAIVDIKRPKIVVLGGLCDHAFVPQCEEFDGKSWKTSGTLAVPKASFGVAYPPPAFWRTRQ